MNQLNAVENEMLKSNGSLREDGERIERRSVWREVMVRPQFGRTSDQSGLIPTPRGFWTSGETLLRAAAGLLLLSFAAYSGAEFAAILDSAIGVDRQLGAQSLIAAVAAITVTVGYTVLAALPLRGTHRVAQIVVSIAALLFILGFSQRFSSQEGTLFASRGLGLLMVGLWMIGISRLVMRIPKLDVSRAVVSAVALVLLGQMIPILL